jgi:hypothetical protein
VGILGGSGVSISLDSVSKVVSWGINWLWLSIDWGRSISWNWGWGISWSRGCGNNSHWLLAENNWSRGKNRGRGKDWCRGSTEH